jgi:hypothetical protein
MLDLGADTGYDPLHGLLGLFRLRLRYHLALPRASSPRTSWRPGPDAVHACTRSNLRFRKDLFPVNIQWRGPIEVLTVTSHPPRYRPGAQLPIGRLAPNFHLRCANDPGLAMP